MPRQLDLLPDAAEWQWRSLVREFRERLAASGMTIEEWERSSGLSHSHIYDSRKNGPTVRALNRALRPLGLKLAITVVTPYISGSE